MDLQIDSKSHVPIHVQLEGQIKHLILAGRFEVGSRLPSIRALAGYLRVNRNTVARVISDLEGEGYVESRRGSGVYVVRPPVDEEEAKRHEVLERVMDLTAARGIPIEELAYALLARGGARPQEKTPILLVECTREELDQFSDELEEQLPVEANIESLRRLTELPEGTPVAVVGWGRTCMENLSRSIEGAGLDHLRFVQVYVDEQTDEVLETLEGVDAVVCASITARKLREIGISRALDIIEEDRVLDQGGIEMLGRMLRERQ